MTFATKFVTSAWYCRDCCQCTTYLLIFGSFKFSLRCLPRKYEFLISSQIVCWFLSISQFIIEDFGSSSRVARILLLRNWSFLFHYTLMMSMRSSFGNYLLIDLMIPFTIRNLLYFIAVYFACPGSQVHFPVPMNSVIQTMLQDCSLFSFGNVCHDTDYPGASLVVIFEADVSL